MNYNKKSIYVFDHINTLINQISRSKKILLFLDYDGTIVHFKSNPLNVKLSSKVKELLKMYRENPNYELIIITGRTLHEIKDQIDIKNINYAAIHGLHIQFDTGKEKIVHQAKNVEPLLKKVKQDAQTFFSNNDIFIEDKKYTIAFHYRNIPKEKITSFKNKFINIFNKYNKDNIQIMNGNKVIEARPRTWNKGHAVDLFLNRYKSSLLPVYIGDDTTDEDAFQYLKNKGITIFVKNDSQLKTNASYWVENPDEVTKLLSILIKK